MEDLAGELQRIGLAAGLDAVGIAPATPFEDTRRTLHERKAAGLAGAMQFTYRNPDRSTDPARALPGARSLVVGARSYRRAAADHPDGPEPAPAGAVARYSWVDHYEPLREALQAVAVELRRHGHQARVLADDNALVDREAAFRAGLGTYGKNTMLLLHGDRGSEFVLGAVVTDADLANTTPATSPGERSACGPCTRCLPACPTGALVAPGVLDANRCLAWLLQADGDFPRQHREALGRRLYGCDECQDVCPPNRLEVRRRPPPPAEPDAEPAVDVLALLDEPDDDELLRRHARWYVARRDARYLRRNALVVLGNVGHPSDERTAATLRRYADPSTNDDELLRRHAVWAAARLGRHDLLDATDPTTQHELGALAEPRQA